MTLNIMLTSNSGVYLSGDFRLTYSPGEWRDNIHTQKLIPVFRFGWSALVSFTGIAATPQGLNVGEWLAYQLANIDMEAPYADLRTKLLEANRWLKGFSERRPLAFSVVGFVGRKPIAMIISNFLDLDGRVSRPIQPELRVFVCKPKSPEVRFAGDRSDVHTADVARLKKVLIESRDSREVQAVMAEINAAVAQRAGSSGTISRECVTGYLAPTGAADVIPHVSLGKSQEYMPAFVHRRFAAHGTLGFICKTNEAGRRLPPQWRGMTAKVQGVGKRAAVVTIDAIGNVKEVVQGKTPDNVKTFMKVAEENEPKTITFNIDWSDGK